MSILESRRDRQVKAGTGITVTNAQNNATVAIDGATQANEEAGTANKVVTSDVQQFHPSAAKCWAYVTVSGGTPTLQASYNITSITDTGVGDLTITIATDFSSANWCSVATVEVASAAAANRSALATGKAAGSVELTSSNLVPNLIDPTAWNFLGFGDQ